MRCFIGSILAEADQRKVEALRPSFPDQSVRWVKPHRYHLTLRFLGDDVKHVDLPDYREELKTAREMFPIEVMAASLHGFPNPQRARVLVLLLHSDGRLEALRPEQRSFLPHITLGYSRSRYLDVPCRRDGLCITVPKPSLYVSEPDGYRKLKI